MPIKKVKPTSNARRQMSVLTYDELKPSKNVQVKGKKRLLSPKKQNSGRNSSGSITVRHRGGGCKRKLRAIDTQRTDKLNVEGVVTALEYDPNRSAFLMLVTYKDGDKRYHLAPADIEIGDKIMTAKKTKAKVGNRMMLESIPVGFEISNIQLNLSGKGQLARSAGARAKLVSLDGDLAHVELPSGEVRFVHKTCYADIGRVSNIDHQNAVVGKAGRTRLKGRRPQVRGKAMNPCDHPHGGGEGGSPIGMKYPKTPWGLHALGVKTRARKKASNDMIVRTRKGKVVTNVN
ncbi:50S ribosomal protein L2 [Patescibacteria group bacterium]|nr:50S ribosomal protein L2 [Patescibacteria group bacterium]